MLIFPTIPIYSFFQKSGRKVIPKSVGTFMDTFLLSAEEIENPCQISEKGGNGSFYAFHSPVNREGFKSPILSVLG